MLIGYARLSAGDQQDGLRQTRMLREAGCDRVVTERASSGRWDRPELQHLLESLQPGDILMVPELGRLSRSLKEVLHLLDRIAQAGAGFRSLSEGIETTGPAGHMLMRMIGSFAAFERLMLLERTGAGLANARAAGRIGGRRRKLDATQRREIAEKILSGTHSGAEMARRHGISQPTVSRIVAEYRVFSQSGSSIAP
ncbi:recombinase family protein [Niveispirillum sp.]|uniref:recombinase family protein n=1 Tax=Niveispirillum sp. TaxID=1917217 RepID=UPI001B4607E7|nr:recombinase family protein [Niveispirillum sp.]MBP7339213.1 recombinase family protein [Niveispirillum sp.]